MLICFYVTQAFNHNFKLHLPSTRCCRDINIYGTPNSMPCLMNVFLWWGDIHLRNRPKLHREGWKIWRRVNLVSPAQQSVRPPAVSTLTPPVGIFIDMPQDISNEISFKQFSFSVSYHRLFRVNDYLSCTFRIGQILLATQCNYENNGFSRFGMILLRKFIRMSQ